MQLYQNQERITGSLKTLIEPFFRKSRQFLTDPVLRKWLAGRLVGHYIPPPAFRAHHPPYLDRHPKRRGPDASLPLGNCSQPSGLRSEASNEPLHLPLPGETVAVLPGAEADIFHRSFDDTESLLGLHRFAWVPLLANLLKPKSLDALWTTWITSFSKPKDGWPWHPYTAAERAINIIDYAAANDFPGDPAATKAALRAHAAPIAEGLEYWGEHNTSNHLANNGRGLYRIGLALGLDWAADMGRDILLNEATRIFRPSGILREGSSHYHLLYTQRYLDAWLHAQTLGRPEAKDLSAITMRALGALQHLRMPGGFPLIGDISPDSPPGFLAGLIENNETGWTSSLCVESAARIKTLLQNTISVPVDDMCRDGWLRRDFGSWSAIWYVAPGGWPPMPGHGHQDLGSFELHFESERLIVDPGRGAYGDGGDSIHYYSAEAHNLLSIDGAGPSAENRPYYDNRFRTAVSGASPRIEILDDSVSLSIEGFRRLGDVGTCVRRWTFSPKRLRIDDRVDGMRFAQLVRHLHVPHSVSQEGDAVIISGARRCYRVRCDGAVVRLSATKVWSAYGISNPGTRISFVAATRLPWSGTLWIEVI